MQVSSSPNAFAGQAEYGTAESKQDSVPLSGCLEKVMEPILPNRKLLYLLITSGWLKT